MILASISYSFFYSVDSPHPPSREPTNVNSDENNDEPTSN